MSALDRPPPAAHTVLQIGFGFGAAFLDAWQQARDAPSPQGLDFVAIAAPWPVAERLRAAHRGTPRQALADALAHRWPPLTRNLHRIAFDQGRIRLLLAPGPAHVWLPELRGSFDALRLDAVDWTHDPHAGPRQLAKALARLAAAGAPLQVAAGLEALEPALRSAGFRIGPSGDEGLRGVFAPRFVPRGPQRPASAREAFAGPPADERHVLIVGAGLAGCATACALAERGWRSTLLDRRDAPAREGSGNTAGLFHGTVNAQDGAHARFNRAAALQAHDAVQQAIDGGLARGRAGGLLRLETSGKTLETMHAELVSLQLPPAYVQALSAEAASARCGLQLQHPAWFYPGGGWVEPAGLARSFLQRAGAMVRFVGLAEVQRLERGDGRWRLFDDTGRCLGEAPQLVLANAHDALRLLRATDWPLQAVRGQISRLDQRALAPAQRLQLPSLPVAGAGYLLPDLDGQALFGASAQAGDTEPQLRAADHAFNRDRLRTLCNQTLDETLPLQGRVAWRCVADDRLPLIGRVPDDRVSLPQRVERLIDVPRQPGLHLFTGLSSRGISWAALGGQLLAAQIDGAPLPLEAALVDALDPARFALRRLRLR